MVFSFTYVFDVCHQIGAEVALIKAVVILSPRLHHHVYTWLPLRLLSL